MFGPLKRATSVDQASYDEKDAMDDNASQYIPCPHRNLPPTPMLDAHLRQANTRARLEEIRDALTHVIEADEQSCLKCVTTNAARALFLYLRDLREIKGNMKYSKTEKKAAKQEMKTMAHQLKKDLKPTLKGR
ncbi:hypothetical protein AC578_4847 [Pseudocercospora eumusae]|uniref:Uncharacterized protein n=1 Tax=Pseudocercospora eumusae TaxID=321146 RepID=A0A139HC70_9PEZI|nr:hypothetical protein AC578_4847 [Pseudocercospora eumusae]